MAHLDVVEHTTVHVAPARADNLRLLPAPQPRGHKLVQGLLQEPLRRPLRTAQCRHIRKLSMGSDVGLSVSLANYFIPSQYQIL